MRNSITFFISAALLATLLFFLATPIGTIPPIGKFFHPVQGFWANAETRPATGDVLLDLEGVEEPVEIFYDERGVPHIFAENDHDLYFAQGYVTARDRLFQMELQVRAAGGKLAEWLGERLINYDRNQRRLGMLYGAEQAFSAIQQDEVMSGVISAYAEGVNAYIETLRYEDYPLEYKVLDVEPSEWSEMNTALLLKYMTQTLAGRSEDIITSNTLSRFGEEFVNRYLSDRSQYMVSIIPDEKEWEFDPQSRSAPDSLYDPLYNDEIQLWQPDPLNGSNNWVVDGSKTEGGYPMLSNDMHLNMTLPAIWYEVQLQTPDHNVYGVSLQGAPTVIVGFNEQIAWGSTNTGADVMDWYEITFRDSTKQEYLYDGEWLPVEQRIEEIGVKGGETVRDTVLYTHHGPVYESDEERTVDERRQNDMALRWIAHDPSNELLTFYKLNRGKGVEDFREAFRTFQAPAQNMNYAGVDGNIAMQTGGYFPLKWRFQGRTVSDGSDSAYDWGEFIPFEQNPYSVNPEQGYLTAANQYPVPEDYPYYLGDSFAPYERGRRINDLLRDSENLTVDDYKVMLMDSFSYNAYHILPVLLETYDSSAADERTGRALEILADWNYVNEGDQIAPSIFRYWRLELTRGTLRDEYDTSYPMRWPDRDQFVDLILEEPDSPLFDNISTEDEESFEDIVQASLSAALDSLASDFGDEMENWRWAEVNNTNLNHLANIPGMGMYDIATDGGGESVNAIRGSHGPSWRMVVELDPEGVRGYGVYPGGQSGNPGSKSYTEFIETWRTGELYELLFLREKPENNEEFPLTIRMD